MRGILFFRWNAHAIARHAPSLVAEQPSSVFEGRHRRASGVGFKHEAVERHGFRVVQQQHTAQGSLKPEQNFDRFRGLQDPNQSGQNAKHTRLRTRRNGFRRRGFGKQIPITRSTVMIEQAHLAFEAEDRPVNPRQAEQGTRIVHEVTGGKVIGSVDDEVPSLHDLQGVSGVQSGGVGHHFNRIIEGG